MKKALLAIIACCFAVTTAFAQLTLETRLNDEKPQDEASITDIFEHEHGRIFIKINGEPDEQGLTPVQIELENNSDSYDFLLFDHAWSKKELRKNWKVYLEKGIGDNSLPLKDIYLDIYQSNLIPRNTGRRYTFPDVFVEEGKDYECKIPIHLNQSKPSLFNKKKRIVHSIIDCTVLISVDNKDEAYEKLKSECDSLLVAFNEALAREEFCTNPNHHPSFEKQTEKYTTANHELRDQVRRPLYDKSCSKESQKYKRYKALLDSLDRMDIALEQYKGEKHDCGGDDRRRHKCGYCKLSLQQIYNLLNRHYMDLHNGTVQKSEIMKEVNALYKCCTDPTCANHAQQWKKGDPYKAGIIEFYNKIKNY